MKRLTLTLICILCTLLSSGQLPNGIINPKLKATRWPAQWIKVQNASDNDYGVYHFRKTFELKEKPEHFWIHVSADNRYKLYVNGTLASLGPACCDVYNWAFETIDIAPWLKRGNNTLASVVWNFGTYKPVAQMSFQQTAFIVQGNGPTEQIANTDKSWKGIQNKSYKPINCNLKTYFVAGPGEEVDAAQYPWEWNRENYDDSFWKPAVPIMSGAGKGAMDYPGWQLVPRSIPQMELKDERIPELRQAQGVKKTDWFPLNKRNYSIPAFSKISLLLDQTHLTTAYLNLKFSKGKNARINLSYAESLYEDTPKNRIKPQYKSNRNEIDKKFFWGYNDRIIADGGENRWFTSLWWRTYRYILLEIETESEPLLLHDIYGTFTAYPFELKSEFSAPEIPELDKILSVGWRTARLCANETYMDCPYYEQLQYFGDTRIQAMVSLYNCHDDRLVRNAIDCGKRSIISDGITMSRYPTNLHQFISSYPIWWIATVHDYWMYRNDPQYVSEQLPYIRMILSFYEKYLKEDASLSKIPYWFFVDWTDGFVNGEPSRSPEGKSSIQDLHYLIGLQLAAELEENIGIKAMGLHYKKIASRIIADFKNKYWDSERKLFADNSSHDSFSQHANILAILTEIVKGEEAKEIMQTLLKDKSLIQSSIYFRYYLQMALAKVGLGNDYLNMLDIWYAQLDLGLSTWAEQPEPSRSDCHAWGCSPNIELFRIVLGIQSKSHGFKHILIAPQLGKLKKANGKIPHPNGFISVNYQIDEQGKIQADISLPIHTSGTFRWNGKDYELKSGKQTIKAI